MTEDFHVVGNSDLAWVCISMSKRLRGVHETLGVKLTRTELLTNSFPVYPASRHMCNVCVLSTLHLIIHVMPVFFSA